MGIDFTGGTLIKIGYQQAADLTMLRNTLEESGIVFGVGILVSVAGWFEWKFSTGAIIATIHDVIVILGFLYFRPGVC